MTSAPPIHVNLLESGSVLRLLLDHRPDNALTTETMRQLRAELEAHSGDQHLKLVALQGAGGTFSRGAPIEEHRRDHAKLLLAAFHGLARVVAGYGVPVAAVVEGACVGAAFELALCCHFVLASRDAVFACPQIKLGIFPPVLAVLGPQRLGAATAERLVLTGGDVRADELAGTGFITSLFDVGADAEAEVVSWYRRTLGGLSAFAIREAARAARIGAVTPELLADRLDAVEGRYVEHMLASHDANEGVEAAMGRRAPRWRDA